MKLSIFSVAWLMHPSAGHLRKLNNAGSHDCVMYMLDSMMIPGGDEDFFERNTPEENEWRCLLQGEDEIDNHFYEISSNYAGYVASHSQEWVSGKTVLSISEAEVTGLGPEEDAPKLVISESSSITEKSATEAEMRRRLAPTTGTGSVLVVRVTDSANNAPTRTAAQLSSDVFTDDVNLDSSYMACSGGALGYEPATGNGSIVNGVVEVTLSQNTQGVGSNTVEGWVDTAAAAVVGSLTQWTLVMYVLPGVVDFGSAAAYAYVNSWKSVYLNTYASYPVVLVHEVGHNLGLAHSGKDGVTYGDKTCWMGNGVGQFWSNDDIPQMCFNAAKSWQLGWYADRQVQVNPTTAGRWESKLVGIDDYLNEQIPNGNAHHVIVKVEIGSTDIYLFYNRKEGRTQDVPQDFDKVVVYKQGSGYSQSSNIAQLGLNEAHTEPNVSGSNLIIQVCDIASGTPDYASTMVCLDNGANDCTCSVTSSPTAAPVACSGSLFTMDLLTDNYGSETSWNLKKGGATITSGSGYASNTQYNFGYDANQICLSTGEHVFTINDSYGDGICCSYGTGKYELFLNGVSIKEGGQFTSTETFTFTVGSSPTPPTLPPTPSPTKSPTPPPTLPPTPSPTKSPTPPPTLPPTPSPTNSPTPPPTPSPTKSPTAPPTNPPTTASPVSQPTGTAAPTITSSNNATDYEEIFFNDFEAPNSWGNFVSGGIYASRYTADKHAYSGQAALRIREGDGKNSAIMSSDFDVSEYTYINVRFVFKSLGVETGEAFAFEYSVDGGANYYTKNTWRNGVDFENGQFYGMMENVVVKPSDEKMQVRFIALGDESNDRYFIDNVSVDGYFE